MQSRLRILLAEDEEVDFLSVQRAAANAELPSLLKRVVDGYEALRYIVGEGEYANRVEYPEPQVVLLDLKMPRKTGYEVLEWLRNHEKYCALPAIIMSTSAHPSDVERAYALGANTYFVKPLELSGFARLYQNLLSYWHGAITPFAEPLRF